MTKKNEVKETDKVTPSKKTVSKKTTVKKKAENSSQAEEKKVESINNDLEAKLVEAKKQQAARKAISYDSPIACRSVVNGPLILIGKNNIRYEWGGYGDIVFLPFSEIMNLKSSRSAFLFTPWFMILDENVMEIAEYKKSFKDMYKLYEGFSDRESFFDCSPSEMAAKLDNAPVGFAQLISSVAATLIDEGKLDSIAMINAIDSTLGTNLKIFLN